MSPEVGMARADFLARVRAALAWRNPERSQPGASVTAGEWIGRAERMRAMAVDRWEELLLRFTGELEAVAGVVHRADLSTVPAVVSRLARERHLSRVIAWNDSAIGVPGLLSALLADGFEVLDGSRDRDRPESPAEREQRRMRMGLGEIGLTGVDYAIAETGSLVLLSGPGRGRLVSALPMVHVAILRPGRLFETLEEAGVLLEAFHRERSGGDLPSSITFITGPSRTADIGLSLTRGAHGPKEVHVIALA